MKALSTFVFACALVLGAFNAQAQAPGNEGEVTINVDERVNQYLAKRKQQRLADSTQKGYRIQLLFADKRADAQQAKQKFLSMYPDCSADLFFDSPYFKVRVGDFKTKLEAQPMLFHLRDHFSTLFLIEDTINPPPIVPCY